MDAIGIIASQFVDLAMKYEEEKWKNIKRLPKNEVQVLFEIVKAAGFNPKRIILGELRGNYLDQDGSRTGETYPINRLCPFKMIDQEGGDYYFATGWLDYALQRVVCDMFEEEETRKQLIQAIQIEIKRSISLKPIQLTSDGDFLCENPPALLRDFNYFVDHTRDKDRLERNDCVGIHMHCDGDLYCRRATRTHDAIVCDDCHLRVLFPKKVKTYGELRKALKNN